MQTTPPPIMTTTNLDWPTDWDAIFAASRPLILDIGFGYGHSLAYLQAAHPDHNIIGLEVDNTSLRKAEKRVVRDGWPNVRIVRGFAETALQHLFPPDSLHQIHVNFPDPWFKARHAGRRLIKRATLDAIASRLTVGGLLYLATDIIEYAEMSRDLLHQTPALVNTLPSDWVAERPQPFATKYEARARKEGRPCHYFVYRRADVAAPTVPTITELPMPHIVFKTPLDLDAMMHAVATPNHQDDALTIKFLDRYRGARAVLFEVFIHEPTLDQRIAFVLVEKEDESGAFTLKLSTLGHPRPTAGVHHAARIIADGLLALSPDVSVIHDKIGG